jgi:predicted membrane protein
MEQDEIKTKKPHNKNLIGILLIAGGILLLVHKMGILLIPSWIFTWPVLVIGIGFFIGLQHNFRHFIWIILILWGSFALVDQQMPEYNLHQYTSAIALILVGLFFIFRHNKSFKNSYRFKGKYANYNYANAAALENNDGEYLDTTSVFGGAKKIVVSKNFKGGDLTSFMGGIEIDLTQADIQGTAVIDATAVFGGIKLIVPGNWHLKIDPTAVLGGVEDKRQLQNVIADVSKTLVIDATAVFGGIEITNY